MKNYRKSIGLAALLLVAASCTEKKAGTTTVEEKPQVRLETVNVQPVPQTQEFTATVEADIVNNILPSMPLRIEKIYVEVGDEVKAGQLLVQMDSANLKQSKTQLDNIRLEYDRQAALYEVGGTSKQALDAQKTQLDVAMTSFDNLKENTQLLSPIDGIVTARNYDNGDMYGGNPVLTVQKIKPVKLMINVSEGFYTQVKPGMEVKIRLDVYKDEEFTGKVSLVYPTIDAGTRTFPVEIELANKDMRVRPGMFARVTVNFGTEQRVVLPDLAVVKQTGSGDRYVYVYNDGKVDFVKVELGRRTGTKYEVISGVPDGARVVVAGQSRLTNGSEVTVVD